MWVVMILILGAFAQWKTPTWFSRFTAWRDTSPEVGRWFVQLARRPDETLRPWLEEVKASPWEATGELPVVRRGDGAIDTQPRLGET
jgi:hypothetical protein